MISLADLDRSGATEGGDEGGDGIHLQSSSAAKLRKVLEAVKMKRRWRSMIVSQIYTESEAYMVQQRMWWMAQ